MLIIKNIVYIILFLYFIYFCVLLIKYHQYKDMYGKINTDLYFLRNYKYKIYTSCNSKNYLYLKQLILQSKFKSVELFSLSRHVLVFIILALGIPIVNTNTAMNLQNTLSGYTVEQQQVILSSLNGMIDIANVSPDLYNVISDVNLIANDIAPYLFLVLLLFLAYNIPVYILQLKRYMLNSKKDWEIVNLITIAAIDSSNKVDKVVTSMVDTSYVYNNLLCQFKNEMEENLDSGELLDTVNDDSLRELMETLILCKEIGLDKGKDNINELLDFKLKYMDIIAKKSRSIKSAVSLLPVALILIMLFGYLMIGLNSITQNMFTNI